jgi:hypothetical protein
MPRTELRTEIEIDAPVTHVYRVLTDFERYHEWNPLIPSLSGKLAVGEKLSLELSLPEGKTYLLTPRVLQVVESEQLRWSSQFWLPSLLEAEHFLLLSERGDGRTRVVQGLNFSGFLLRFAGQAPTLTARGFVYMNQALKKRAESSWRAAG